MPTSMLHIKPEDLKTLENRQKYTVSIIGCRQIGILQACLFAEAGFKVVCVDSDRVAIDNIAKGKTPFLRHELRSLLRKLIKNGNLKTTSDFKMAISQSEIVVITTSVNIDEKKKPNYSDVERVCKSVGSNLRQGSLVIFTSVVGMDATDSLIKKVLEDNSGLTVGVDFGLAYSPARASKRELWGEVSCCKRVAAATDKDSLNAASTVLELITKGNMMKTDEVRALEAATLFTAAQNKVDSALANELALLCEKASIDYLTVKEIAETSASRMLAPVKLTGTNASVESCLLSEEAENLNVKLRLPKVAKEVEEDAFRHAVGLIKDALKGCGKPLRRARISLFGISQTPNVRANPKISTRKLAKMLETKGAKVALYDPYVARKKSVYFGYPLKRILKEAIESADCIVIVTGHDQFRRLNLKRVKIMAKMPAAIVDLEGVIDPEKVEREGFIYRGLGRGIWSK